MKQDSIRILIDKELKEEFKSICENTDRDMSKVITRFIKGFINENHEKGIK